MEFVEVSGKEFTLPDGSETVTRECKDHAFVIAEPTYYTPDGYPMSPEEVLAKPPEVAYPQHWEWQDILYGLVFLVTIPIWGPIALLVQLAIGIRRIWDYVRRERIAKATRRQ